MDYLITLAQLLGAFGALWAVNTVMSIRNNITQKGFTFDGKYFLNGVIKAVVLVLAMGAGGATLIFLPTIFDNAGVMLSDEMKAAISIVGVFAAVAGGLISQAKKFVENVGDTFNKDNIKLSVKVDPEDFNKGIIFDASLSLSDDYIESKLKSEKIGGLGSIYTVPTDSYANFKKEVLGNGYDIDNAYGWQCWDGTALLWQQFGKQLITGNGLAIGCWDLNKDRNKYDLFNLVTKVDDLKLGDVVVMRPNHIGFFDGFNGAYMRILGQNQGTGKTNPNGGAAFTVVNVAKSSFAGAFRLKKWNKTPAPAPKPTQPKPVPQPKPTPKPAPSKFKVGDKVVPTKLVNYVGAPLVKYDKSYTLIEVIGDRAVLSARGQVWAAMNTKDIRKV